MQWYPDQNLQLLARISTLDRFEVQIGVTYNSTLEDSKEEAWDKLVSNSGQTHWEGS